MWSLGSQKNAKLGPFEVGAAARAEGAVVAAVVEPAVVVAVTGIAIGMGVVGIAVVRRSSSHRPA